MPNFFLFQGQPTAIQLYTQSGGPSLLQTSPVGPGIVSPLGPTSPQGQIYIDPANVSGVASDSNPPTITPTGFIQAGPVFRTFVGVVAAWGTFSPVLTLSTNLAFLSSHPDGTDPVVWTPICRAGAVPSVTGLPANGTANALTALTARNQTAGANSALLPTYGTVVPVAGQRVLNTTHSSIAWQSGGIAGQQARTSQPMAFVIFTGAVAPQGPTPAEVNTWANGDSIQVQTLLNVNLVCFAPTISDFPNAGPPNFGQVTDINISDPTGNADYVYLENVVVQQCKLSRKATNWAAGSMQTQGINGASVILSNCFAAAALDFSAGSLRISGGSIAGIGSTASSSAITIDGDTIIETALTLTNCTTSIGFVCLAANIAIVGGIASFVTIAYAGHIVYAATTAGTGVVTLAGDARANFAGTATASFTAPSMVTGVTMNGGTTAISHTGASPDVFNNTSTTVAHIDAAAGATGFGGVAVVWGGASLANAA